jgi:hypothetical protein
MAVKGYFVSVFMIFVHVVTIQLAGTFLTLPEQTNNSLISVAVAIGLLLTLLKIPSFMMQLILFSRSVGAVRHVGSQITNVLIPIQVPVLLLRPPDRLIRPEGQ